MTAQHEYVNLRDKPGRLDRALRDFARDGRRVLGFWRSGSWWTFKLMAER